MVYNHNKVYHIRRCFKIRNISGSHQQNRRENVDFFVLKYKKKNREIPFHEINVQKKVQFDKTVFTSE